MPLHTIQYTFAGGEIAPNVRGRLDVARYYNSLAVCENYRTLQQGGLQRRDGFEFIAPTKFQDKKCRLERFEFSITQAYILEFGDLYVRFFTDRAPLQSGGVPVEVVTPYTEAQLFDLQFTQSADVLYIVHPSHPPATLSRLAATSWEYNVITHRPPPLFEKDTDLATTLTPGATSGTGVTLTAGNPVFLDADVDRQIVAGTARAIITALGSASPSATVTATILSPFAGLGAIASGSWFITGSPRAAIRPTRDAPEGGEVTLNLERDLTTQAELMTNGDFSLGATGWTDHSGPTISTGTATGGTDEQLDDSGATFQTDGALANHRVENINDSTEDTVITVNSETQLATSVGGATWSAGKQYRVRQTGTFTATGGTGQINGGAQGIAWIEQSITTVVGESYQLEFDVSDAPLSLQVGATSQASDILAEATYNIGNDQQVTFVATATSTFIQFRNNQNASATVDNVSCKSLSAEGWRSADVGKLVRLAGGTVEILRFTDATQVIAVVWDKLTLSDPIVSIAAGNWVLGENSWSAANGYPRGVTFHQGRLCYLGTAQQPLTIWMSQSGLFDNFSLGDGSADDAVEITLSANQMNTLEWGEPFRDLLVGTRGGEHLITGGNNPITPTNVAQVPQDTAGSPPLRPLRIGRALIHVERDRRCIRELTIEADTGLIRAEDLTIVAEHITESGIVQWAFQRSPQKTIWAIRNDGQLIGFSFDLPEQVRGWHRHTTHQGSFESVAVIPIDAGSNEEVNELWVVTKRTGNGTQRFVEVARPRQLTAARKEAALTLDAATRFNLATAQTTFTGLGHLDGHTATLVGREEVTQVDVFGLPRTVHRLINLGTADVAGGQITLPDAIKILDVGLPFTPTATTLPPEVDLQSGSIQARKKRWVNNTIRTIESIGVTVDGIQFDPRTTDDFLDTYIAPHDADYRVQGIGWETDGAITVTQPLPFPSTITAIIGELEVEDSD